MRLPAVFSDHMVLQHSQPIPVWGWAEPGEAISVELAGTVVHTAADRNGTWRVELPAVSIGGPYELTVSGKETITIGDVLAGEVWICSGQSNMEWPLELANNPQVEVAAADYPRIRLLTVPRTPSLKPLDNVTGAWGVCDSSSASKFSAVAYFFGRELHKQLGVPIGLINSSWGGTRAEAWTSRAGLSAEPSLKEVVTELDVAMVESQDEAQSRYAKARAEWYRQLPADTGNRGLAEGWAKTDFDDSGWKTMRLPAYWQQAGHMTNGVFWFRLAINIPADWTGRDLQLSLGAVDKSDDTYFNGERVGGLCWATESNSWNMGRVYALPAAGVRPGRNVIAVRVLSNFTGGGIVGPSSEMKLRPVGSSTKTAVPLFGDWRYCIEQDFGRITTPGEPASPNNANTPTALFNGMIAPLIPFALRGAIWYQGESNAGNADRYRVLFPQMIRDWRSHWKQGDFPFYFVQLANFGSTDMLARSSWAQLRDSQTQTLALPNTGMAVTIDIGETADIHPRNKQDVGLRLALNALSKTYGKNVAYRGPVFRSLKVEGRAIRISFDNAAGLKASGGVVSGFVIAGSDGRFVPAQAQLENETIVLSSPEITAPAAARYGWADCPTCTLYNGAGLPAEPFRTDDWPL